MKTKHALILELWLLAILFCAAIVSVANGQDLPAPQPPVVVTAPAQAVAAPPVVVKVPAPIVKVPPVVVEAAPPVVDVAPPVVQQPATIIQQPSAVVAPRVPANIPTPVGSVLASSWYDARLNRSPGKTNHLAVYVGDGKVVESQAGIGVHEIPWAEYEARPQHVLVVPPPSAEFGQAAAARAKALVGLPYFKLSSVTVFERPLARGLNCVSVAEKSWLVHLVIPDDIYTAYPGLAIGPLARNPNAVAPAPAAPRAVASISAPRIFRPLQIFR